VNSYGPIVGATSNALNPLAEICGCPTRVAEVAAPATLRAAADLIEGRYPTDVWPEDSQHPESRVAAGVRLACKQLRHEADLIEGGVDSHA
jgi:hypothetical protein